VTNQDIVNQTGEAVSFMVGGFEKLAPFSFTEVFAVFVEGFNMRFDIEQSSQFMRNVADELALASLSSTSRVISYRHGNALNTFPILVKNRGEENTDGAVGWLGEGNSELSAVAFARCHLVRAC